MDRTAAICLPGVGYRSATFARAVTRLVRELKSLDITVVSFLGASGTALMEINYGQAKDQDELIVLCEGVEIIWEKIGGHGPQKVIPFESAEIVGSFKSFSPVLLKSTILRQILAPYLVSSQSLYDLLNGALLGTPPIDVQRVVNSPIHLDIFLESIRENPDDLTVTRAWDLISNRDQMVRDNPAFIIDAAVASASLTGIFPKIKIGNAYYRDSGIVDPWVAINRGYDFVFVLTAEFQTVRDPNAKDWLVKNFYDAAIFDLIGENSNMRGIINDRLYLEAARKLAELEVARKLAERDTGKLERTAAWIEQKKQKICRIILGGKTSTFHVHTFKKEDIPWALELGDTQMKAEIERLEQEKFFE